MAGTPDGLRAQAASGSRSPSGLKLYRCEPLVAWITPTTCEGLAKRSERSKAVFGRVVPVTVRPLPCSTCPGVVRLSRRKGATPPRVLA
jgi:hypothetical protein